MSVVKVAEIEPGESLESRSGSVRAVAAIRLMKAGSGFVEMTIVDRATGKTVSRRLAIATPAEFLTGGPWLGAGLEFELSSTFAVFAGADCGLSLPRTVIRSAGRELVSFGRPLCAGAAGVTVSWH